MEDAEKKYGKWDYKALQLDSETQSYEDLELRELQRQHASVDPRYNNPIALAKLTSDPIFGTLEPLGEHDHNGAYGKVVQYPDPDVQGLDEDIKSTQKNLVSSQKYWKHDWNYNTTADMPNFAIPGKKQYDGENMTKTKTLGPWNIPFPSDKAAAKPAAALVVASPANATV
jgi:hypothetical protein